MKIAFLTPEYPHPKTGRAGGIGTSIFNLCKGLKALGHQPIILVYGQDKDTYFKDDDISFYKIKNIKVKGLSTYLTQKKVQKLINNLYSDDKIDIVEAPDWTGFTAFIKAKCPLIIRLNGSDTYFCHLDGRKVKAKNRFLEKRALNSAHGIISVSRFTGEMTNSIFGLDLNFTVIPNAIDITSFTPLIKKSQDQTILYFGTLIRKKGLLELPHTFNHVFSKNPEAKLVLIGKDASDINTGSKSTWALMKSLFKVDSIKNVHYKGPVSYGEMQNLIKEASVCVFPTFAEALPVSWLEAMAMEKPIVASNVGWATEMIDDEIDGYLVAPEDHQKYADRVLDLLANTELQKQFGMLARKKVRDRFSTLVVAEKSIAYYQKYVKP